MKRADGKRDWPFGGSAEDAARARLRELIASERKRARTHILFIKRGEPDASRDRIAHLMVERWTKLAQVEGGMTGALGFVGVPINLLLFAYFQIALIVSIAEINDTPLEGASGEEVVLDVLGRAHGAADVLRSSPRVLGAIAKAIALRHGFSLVGRVVPLVASPIAAKLNEREMSRLGSEALRRFGNVVRIE